MKTLKLKKILIFLSYLIIIFQSVGCSNPNQQDKNKDVRVLAPYNGEELKYRLSKFILNYADMNKAKNSEILLNGKNITEQFKWFGERLLLGGTVNRVMVIDIEKYGKKGVNVLRVTVKKPNSKEFVKEINFTYNPYPESSLFEVRDTKTSNLIPAKLTFEGIDGTPTPNFSNKESFKVFYFNYRSSKGNNIFLLPEGNDNISMSPGKYKVTASAGIFYTCSEKNITFPSDGKIEFFIEKVIDEKKYVPSDFHVHSAISGDCYEIPEDKIRDYACANVRFMVSSDHDKLMDYAPIIKEMGFENRIKSSVGVEFGIGKHNDTTKSTDEEVSNLRSIGHWNAWPLKRDESLDYYGALKHEIDTEPAESYELYREKIWKTFGNNVHGIIQLNHPRGIQFNSTDFIERYHDFFHVNNFDPLKLVPKSYNKDVPNSFLLQTSKSSKTKNIDFDLFELINRSSWKIYKEVRLDWFSLLNQGIFKPATANSDSHSILHDPAGFPLNLVFLEGKDSDVDNFTPDEINAAVLRGRTIGTTGPVIHLSAKNLDSGKEAYIGDTIETVNGGIEINFKIEAAPWINIDEVRLIVNGETLFTYKLEDNNREVMRIEKREKIIISKNSWIIVEAGPKIDDQQPRISKEYKTIAPNFVPMAFTNPIFVTVKN